LKHCLCNAPSIGWPTRQFAEVNPIRFAHLIILSFWCVICNLITRGLPLIGFLQAMQLTFNFMLGKLNHLLSMGNLA
jgi:hypothetical protein